MVVPAFGFSVGDFIAAIQLIGEVSKALGNTSGATNQYQQAVLELNILENVLRQVQGLECSAENATIVEKIHLCAHACHVPLAEFITEIKKFEEHLRLEKKTKLSILQNGRKVQWTVVVEDRLAILKGKIGPLLASISILLQLASTEDVSRLSNRCLECNDLHRKTITHVEALHNFVTTDLATQVAALLPSIDRLSLQQHQVQQECRKANGVSVDAVISRLDTVQSQLQVLVDKKENGQEVNHASSDSGLRQNLLIV